MIKKLPLSRVLSWVTCALAVCLLLGGVVMLTAPKVEAAWLTWTGGLQNRLTFQVPLGGDSSQVMPDMNLSTPVWLALPRLGMRVNLLPGAYYPASQTWRLDPTHAFYMPVASVAGGLPSTPLFYGHEIPAVFAPLNNVAPGEPLQIGTSDGRTLSFRFASAHVITPTDDSVLTAKLPNAIQLMTCNGDFSQNRRVLQFNFIGVQ
ncbi:MAG TPA: sortase [Candidatus Acidoferrum sp.]|nr:sortase [Candidatus Acidoferrum sp.]